MRIAVLPTKYGYSAVALPPYGGDWELFSPMKLPHDLMIQLRGQILYRLAQYCSDLSVWTGQLPLAILWAGWGIWALAISSLWSYGTRYWILYGWIRFLFFGGGIWLLGKTLAHMRGLLRTRRIRETIVQGQWVITVDGAIQKEEVDNTMTEVCTEREYIQYVLANFPQLKPYYDEMLRVEEPWLFSAAPMGVGGLIKYLLTGVRVPMPALIFDLGELK